MQYPQIKQGAILVGTSGYSYADWMEYGFYPAGTKSAKMLPLYAEHFRITELNNTWYQMPKADATARRLALVPEKFLFTVKLTRSLTHEVEPEFWARRAAEFRAGIAPLQQAGRLLAVLMQLPPSFTRTLENRRYLGNLMAALEGVPLAVEFRHKSWADDHVFAELEKRRVTLVAVDEPPLPNLFPPLDVVTNPALFYVRFHGRNSGGWHSGNMQKQFDYDYAAAELEEWIEKRIGLMARKSAVGVLFFNNHVRAQAPNNALLMMHLLRQRGLETG